MRRNGGLLLILAACLLGMPGAAAAAPVLGHDNLLTAARPGYTEVELPQTIGPFDGSDANDPLISWDFDGGEGWLRHGVLRSEEPGPEGVPVALWFERYHGDSLQGGPWTLWWATLWGSDRLPAGRYRFYLITNAKTPTRARLSFRDLSGSNDLTAETAVPFSERALPLQGVGMVKFGGDGMIGASGGPAFVSLRTTQDTASADRLEFCWYPGGGDKAGSQAYGPGCPGGNSTSDITGATTLSAPTKGGEDTGMTLIDGDPGRLGLGGNATAAGIPKTFETHAAWMSWNDDQPALITPATPGPPAGAMVQTADGSVKTNQPAQTAERQPGPATLTAKRVRMRGSRAGVPLDCARDSSGCSGRVGIAGGRSV